MNYPLNFVRFSLLLALTSCITSCTPAKPIPEAEYSATLVGNWLGTVGDMKESITFKEDGSFIAQLRRRGFISNTLSQGTTGKVSGTWTISGKTITLHIVSAEDEKVKNHEASGTILAFNQDEFSIKSDQGETTKFIRTISP